MLHIITSIRHFWRNEQGVTAMEYALLGALIAVVIVAALSNVGTNLGVLYINIAAQVANAL